MNGLDALALSALREHAPFDEMDAASLQFLAARLSIAYFPRARVILGPESGVADRLYIVKQGRVRGTADAAGEKATDMVLGPGECFPIGSLAGRRPSAYVYRSEGDTFLYELPAADFHALMDRSARFRDFCTDYLAQLVDRSQRALRAEAGEALMDGAGMLAPLRSAFTREPVHCAPSTPVREVLERMRREHIGSMVVADAARVPVGIFTTVDVLERVAAPQADVAAPISGVMTRDPVTLEEEATIADAVLAMARHGIRHVIVTRDGRLAGLVSERDLFALQRVSLRRTAERLRGAATPARLVEVAEDLRKLARHLLAQGVAAEQLTAMVSALNDALAQRLIALVEHHHRLPGHWGWLALGSEGRTEQTFVTDQDNALIFSAEAPLEEARAAFMRFADEVNRGLDACGFPLCKGDVMARNPRWCLTPQEWRAVFDGWIRNPLPEALLNATIFFDLRPLAGEARLAGELRESVLAQTRANRTFLRALTESALRSGPPRGLLRDFTADEIELKGQGARPFVDAARVLSLAEGRPETSTAARLRAAGEAQAAQAFHFVQGLRLRHGNRVRVDALSAIDRRVLKEAFREAALLQERIRLDFGL